MKPATFLLPGAFLVALGLGNIAVGKIRAEEHSEVIAELSSLPPVPAIVESSPLMRIQLTELSEEGLRQRLATAQQRLAFYRLVENGGQIFFGLGLVFMAVAWLIGRRCAGTQDNQQHHK